MALNLTIYWIDPSSETYSDICIIGDGEASLHSVGACKLADYLLAIAPVDVKDA